MSKKRKVVSSTDSRNAMEAQKQMLFDRFLPPVVVTKRKSNPTYRMEQLKETSIHHTAIRLTTEIRGLKTYDSLYKMVQQLVCYPDVDKNQMRKTLEDAIKATGIKTEIRNIIFHLVRNAMKSETTTTTTTTASLTQLTPPPVDALAFLKRSGAQWDRRVRKSLNAMCGELKMPLEGQPRSQTDREEIATKWEEMSNYAMNIGSYRPVYAPKDLLDVLLGLKGPLKSFDMNNLINIPKWEFSHIALPVKNFHQLRAHYKDLLRLETESDTQMANKCQRVLDSGHAPLCQKILKKGNIPPPYRGVMWSTILWSKANDHSIEHWTKLKYQVLNIDHITDKLVFKDVQLTASNDDQYFVFEDVLYQVMLCFSRDTEIASQIQYESYLVKGKQYEGPPSGIVPFHGICMYAAPFCYIYDNPINLYFAFRAFYIRYCHRLTTINTHPQGIVSLCLLFEKLLLTHEPYLWSHFRGLSIQPIRVVFKWIMRAFSGHLPPEQLLILWDLILGYDSLEILPLFAVIILSFRKESLMQVYTLEHSEAILADLSSIKVLPLIQLTLSRD